MAIVLLPSTTGFSTKLGRTRERETGREGEHALAGALPLVLLTGAACLAISDPGTVNAITIML